MNLKLTIWVLLLNCLKITKDLTRLSSFTNDPGKNPYEYGHLNHLEEL